MPDQEPHATLRERFQERSRSAKLEGARSDLLGNIRLLLAVISLILLLLPLGVRSSWPWWTLVPISAVFLFLGLSHDRVSRRERRFAAGARFYQAELDRLEERWRSFPDDGADLTPRSQLLAQADGDGGATPLLARAASSPAEAHAHLVADLDLLGPASLFQLLSRAVTPHGRRALVRLLLEPAPPATIRARQEGVGEISQKLDFREALVVAGNAEASSPLADEALLRFGDHANPLPFNRALRVLVNVEPLLLLAGLLWWLADGPPILLLIAALLQLATLIGFRNPVATRVALLSGPDRSLARYASLIETIEAGDFSALELVTQKQALAIDGRPAAERIRELHGLVERLEYSANMFFAVTIGPLLLWDLRVVLATERWQAQAGPRLRGWLEAIGRVEALASLAGLLHLRPDYSLPSIVEGPGVFRAKALQHPLIDRRRVVGNDLSLDGPGTVLLLSGSNMSGKSTLLRSVGINIVLAQAGGPVAAQGLELSPVVLSTSIRVTDSLAQGTSHFYAELARIRATLELARAQGPRLLYLLDEMLHGTNSKERYIGAVSVIRWLSAQQAVGVVTTHDLALARVEEELPSGKVANRHFGDEVVGDEIRFDYRLREGPVRSTNALRLMRAVGIEIELSAPE